ncbi:MAG TPA: radical SAM protein [Planctomycetota bacterium]|nr:radical SAM protein [Planctomycetota bacterium]
MLFRESSRRDWPFAGLLPYRLYDYPLPAVMKRTPPVEPQAWPPPMAPRVREWRERIGLARALDQIYVHVPLCPFKCDFCAFYKEVGRDKSEDVVDGILREIDLYAGVARTADRPYRSVYLGGGTPTQLRTDQLALVLGAIRRRFPLAPDVEITLEGIAEHFLRPGYLEGCFELGVNRISFGVQSVDPVVRKSIGRGVEDLESFERAVRRARELDPDVPVNVELMIGCPDQSEESVAHDLAEVTRWQTGSVDVSSYVMVPGTRLHHMILSGMRSEPGYGANLLKLRQRVTSTFRAAGYRPARTEVFIRSDRHRFAPTSPEEVGDSLHTVLPLGPSAIGQLEGTSYRNECDLQTYLKAVHAKKLPLERIERMAPATARRRARMNAIGSLYVPDALIDSSRVRGLFRKWERQGLVERGDGGFRLTDAGIHWENQMQTSMLGMGDAVRMLRLIGSVDEQAELVKGKTELSRELLAHTRAEGGLRGWLREAGYKAAVTAMRLAPGVDKRAIGLKGTVEAAPK